MDWIFYLDFFFFNDTATTEIYTLSLHDALPIFAANNEVKFHGVLASVTSSSATTLTALVPGGATTGPITVTTRGGTADRKSTRLNSSHGYISYAVFCLKKKNTSRQTTPARPGPF